MQLVLQIDVGDFSRKIFWHGIGDIAKADDGEFLFRKAQKLSPVSEERTSVFYDGQTAIIPQVESQRIADLVAIVEHTGRLQFPNERSFAQSVRVKVPDDSVNLIWPTLII